MRGDRLITLDVVNPLIKLLRHRLSRKFPVLMYHSINSHPENVHPYFKTHTSSELFRRHLETIRSEGYTFLNPTDFKISFLSNNSWPKQKYVLLSFDDGFLDFYTEAFPILREFEANAIVYLPTGYIGADNIGITGKKHLSWQKVAELAQAGISFGSHSISHAILSKLPSSDLKKEIADSKKEIEDRVGCAVESFSYPYAFPDGHPQFINELRRLLIESGYTWGVSTRIGLTSSSDNRYFIRRLPMNDSDDEALVKAKLNGAYDWLRIVQLIVKVIKTWYF